MSKKRGRGRPPTYSGKRRQITLRLTDDEVKLLGHASAELGKSRHDILIAAMKAYLLGKDGLSRSERDRVRYHVEGAR